MNNEELNSLLSLLNDMDDEEISSVLSKLPKNLVESIMSKAKDNLESRNSNEILVSVLQDKEKLKELFSSEAFLTYCRTRGHKLSSEDILNSSLATLTGLFVGGDDTNA